MHIGYFSSILGTQGGPAIVDKKVIEAISQCDHKHTYTIYGVTEQSTQGLRLNANNHNIKIRNIIPSGKWLAIPFGLTAELTRRPVDLLHATLIAPPIVPCRFVLTITCWSQYSQPELYPPLVRWRLLYLLNRSIRKATAIFCYTQFLKDKVIERFEIPPERIFITQPAVGEEISPINDKQKLKAYLKNHGIEGPYILFIGTLTKRKNIGGLVRAFYILRNESKVDHKLILLGEKGYYFDEIQDTIRELSLENNVIFVDRRPHSELSYFYSGSDLFVFPTFYEGFGLPPLEAMTCGIPVVASNVTSVPEVVGNAALLVNPHHPEDIAEGMAKCIFDTEFRQGLIRKGLERACEFTWERTAKQTIAGYEEVGLKSW